MSALNLAASKRIISETIKAARGAGMNPMAVAVLDEGGRLKAFEREDGCSFGRFEIAHGKAHGALAMGLGSRALEKRAERQAYFIAAACAALNGALIPLAGGVLIRDGAGEIVGAVGVTGDTPDNDEISAVAGIEAAGFEADPG